MYSMPGQGEMKLFVGNLPSDITADPGQGKLFVGNLPSDITADQLQYVLPSAFGPHDPDSVQDSSDM